MEIRTRIAPAPTGRLHIGTAHTALFNYLFAKHHQGKFILRIDDSDAKRSQKEYEKDIIEGLKWLGIKWDEGPDIKGPYGPYRQSERKRFYKPYVQKLLKEKLAYECYCTPEELNKEREEMQKKKLPPMYSGKCRDLSEIERNKYKQQGRKPVVRLKVRPGRVQFNDPTRGTVVVDSKTIGDFVLFRSDGSPLLVFTTTIDDIEMKISHTIRGEDFINLVPRQILLFEALKQKPPIFINLQFIYGPDGSKLSKRHGAKSVLEYRDEGYLSEAITTFLAYLGWSYKDNSDLLSMLQLIKLFSLEKTHTGKPVFDIDKLRWLNGQYIRKKTNSEIINLLTPFLSAKIKKEKLKRIIPLIKERIHTLTEFWEYAEFFFNKPIIKKETLLIQSKHSEKETKGIIDDFTNKLEPISSDKFTFKTVEKIGRSFVGNDWSAMKFFMTIRIAITGKAISPPLVESMEILGKKETLERLKHASQLIK